jgi:hypothetical protein
MRTIQTTAGTAIELDGDVLAVMEAIRRDLSRRKTLDYTYEDVRQEIEHVIGQMDESERRIYLREAFEMSFLHYEHERLLSIVKKPRT